MTDEEVAAHYAESRCAEITGAASGCCAATVLKIARKMGVPVQPRGRAGRALQDFVPGGTSKLTEQEVCDHYKAGLSGPEIARLAGIPTAPIYAVLKKHNVPRRRAISEMVHAGRIAAVQKNTERRDAGGSGLVLPSARKRFGA